MKTILIPTDFSENANIAVEYACELAKSLSAEVLVVNVHIPAVTQYDVVSPIIEEETERAKNIAQENLKSICEEIKKEYGDLFCNSKFIVGGIVEAIDALVKEKRADIVVMGTRGANGLGRILFGSNTTKVIEKVKCPVLAIPSNSPFRIPKRIIYATDFNKKEIDHIGELVTIARAFKAEILMTHITTDREALKSEEMLKVYFSKRVLEITDYEPINYFVKYEENISRALESFSNQIDADWISMLTHDRTLFEKLYNPSLTKSMAFHTEIPLLALKA